MPIRKRVTILTIIYNPYRAQAARTFRLSIPSPMPSPIPIPGTNRCRNGFRSPSIRMRTLSP